MTDTPLTQALLAALDAHKALDMIKIDVRQQTSVTDTMIICTATSTRHAKTLSEKATRAGKLMSIRPLSVSGEEDAEWILIDFADVIVHVMLETAREFYSLENLWQTTQAARQAHTD